VNEIIGKYFFKGNVLFPVDQFEPEFLSQGINVYEVIRFIRGVPLFFEEHYTRLINSTHFNKLCSDITHDLLKEKLLNLITANKQVFGNLKVVLHSSGTEKCELIVYQVPHYYPGDAEYSDGVRVLSLKEERPDPNIKNWRPDFREKIKRLKTSHNVYEILLTNQDGFITEGSQSNFFAIRGDEIITAPASSVLIGITRQKVIALCKKNKLTFSEEFFSLSDLEKMEACFLSGTSPKVLPISQVDSHNFNPRNPLVIRLMRDYDNLIEKYIEENL
jgi:branched-chain amino acid aminotransferase